MHLIIKFFKILRYIHYKAHQSFLRSMLGSGGDSALFYGDALPIVVGMENIFLGQNVKLNEYSYLNARKDAKIIVGNYSTISSYAKLITSQYDIEKWLKQIPTDTEDIHIDRDIIIGDHCWIASNATILGGVKISGTNVIVACGSIVTKSFSESNILIGGIPAKIIKTLI